MQLDQLCLSESTNGAWTHAEDTPSLLNKPHGFKTRTWRRGFVVTITLAPDHVLRDRYIIQKIIGRGGMGSIYLAEDNRLPGRLCAIKEVRQDPNIPEHLRSQGRDQFYREASVLARLDHPNLPKVSDFFSEEDRDYLVMDFVPGEDLKTLMDKARRRNTFLDQSDVLAWAGQLADALEYLHGQPQPVIHRDIKPSNLKLTPSGLVKLVDFGLVKQMVPEEMTVTVIQGRGTALYTPLEQYGGDSGHTDPRTDIYAFGATLYHLLTNQPPVEAKQRFLRPDSLPRPREINPKIDLSVERSILWAMSLHPDQRPQNIAEFLAALGTTGMRKEEEPARLTLLRKLRFLTKTDWALAGAALFLFIVATIATIA
jgi:serine/threonine protein kinase